MVIRLISGRAKDEHAKQELRRMFYRVEASAPHPGWREGWVGFAETDSLAFLVIERWGSRAALEAWQNSPLWRDRLAQSMPLLTGPLTESLYLE